MFETKPLPLVEEIGARYQSLAVDSRLINAFAEKGFGEGETYVYKRPGFLLYQSLGTGTARGLFNWQGNVYAIINGTLFKNGVSIGAVSNAGFYSATACLGATPKLFLHNGSAGWTVTAGDVIAPVVDVDYPTSTTMGTVYLDGTTYVMTAKAEIVGSTAAANDPSAWDPLNLLVAQIEPTIGICLAKQLVYVLALKTNYTEAFYDAGNATGSPLKAVQGAKMNYGCVDARTVRDVGGDLVWVANSGEGNYTVVSVVGLKLEVISTPAIERLLSSGTAGSFSSWNCRIGGHRLYGVTHTSANYTLVYDLTSRLWYQWTNAGGSYVPYTFSCQGAGAETYFLHESNGTICRLDLSTYKDNGESVFPCTVYTPNYDGGTRRIKTLKRLSVLGDMVAANVSISYSDDDYTTWSTAQTVSMLLPVPFIADLGSFARRAFKFTHQAETAFRFKMAEMYIDLGAA